MKRQAEQGSESGQKRPRPEPSTPTRPNKKNDHIYELHKPMEEPSMYILFFHGLEFGDSAESYLKTWMCGDGSDQIWPNTWLVEEFPSAHIFSISYDSSMVTTQEQGRYDLDTVTENLIAAIHCAEIGQAFGCPVVLVGFCFGGLVIKDLCVKAHRRCTLPKKAEVIERFLQNVRGMFFYGTPHRGAPIFDKIASYCRNPMVDIVKLLSLKSSRLEQDFRALLEDKAWRVASMGESRNTLRMPWTWGSIFGLRRGLVVPEGSARYGDDYCTAPADHDTLSKPASKKSMSFQFLIWFLHEIQPKGSELFEKMKMVEGLVGLDPMIKDVQGMLQETKKVAIVGMVGVGKTTLAKALFNEIGPTFEYTCFVAIEKQIKGNVEDVNKKVWDLMRCGGRKMVGNYKDGCLSMLRGKRLLLVWDDITSDIHLQVLFDIVREIDGAKSRFIVTSRGGDILNKMDDIYRVPFLDYTNAKQLFISHAFRKERVVPVALECRVKAIVEKCDGLPLALELLGLGLCRKQNDGVWVDTLSDLDKAIVYSRSDKKLWDQLMSSYSGLIEKEKHMLLDATTFFNGITGWTLHEAKAAWDILHEGPHKLWQTLVDLSLVYDVQEDECIKVHELLQSLGRKKAFESKKSWIWKFTEGEQPHSRGDLNDQTLQLESIELQSLHCGGCPAQIWGCHLYTETTGIHQLKMVHLGDLSIDGAQENGPCPFNHLVLCECHDHQVGLDPICDGYSTFLTHPTIQKLSKTCDTFSIKDLRRSISQLLNLKSLKISGAYNCKLNDRPTRCNCTS